MVRFESLIPQGTVLRKRLLQSMDVLVGMLHCVSNPGPHTECMISIQKQLMAI